MIAKARQVYSINRKKVEIVESHKFGK